MRVLVTGATGFLGSVTALELRRAGHEVLGVGRDAGRGAALRRQGVAFLRADLRDLAQWEAVFDEVDGVVHAAALSTLWGRWEDFYLQNVVVSEAVARACAARGLRLVQVSTPSVYNASGRTLNIPEDTPIGPRFDSLYARSKFLAEGRVQLACPDACLLRPRGIYGVGDSSIVPRIVRGLRSGRLPRLVRGEVWTELTHVRNVAHAIALALHSRAAGIFNVTDGEALPIWATIDQMADRLGWPRPARFIPARLIEGAAQVMEWGYARHPARPEPPLTASGVRLLTRGMSLDLTRARNVLGYRPLVTPPQGVQEVLEGLS